MPNTQRALAVLAVAAIAGLYALEWPGHAQAQGAPAPDLSGTYRCQPDPNPCLWSGSSPSISQSGNKIQIKNDKGEIADGTMTSGTTVTAGGLFNSLGIVRPDHSIDWSDGTTWRKP